MDITTRPDNQTLTALAADAFEYAQASRATSTVAQYESNWRGFEGFCAKHGFTTLPTTPATVSAYLASLAKAGRAPSTIANHLAAIRHFHDKARATVDWSDPVLSQVVSGIRRKSGHEVRQADALLPADLAKILATVDPNRLIGRRDRALFLVGFSGAFRRGELANMRAENVEFAAQGAIVRLVRSKTDQSGEKREEVAIPYAKDENLCAVRALKSWLSFATIRSGPVFRSVNKMGDIRGAITPEGIRLILQRAVEKAGLNGQYSPHSLRAGFCTAAALAGKGIDQTAKHARHAKLDTTRKYQRIADRFRQNAADGVL